MASYQVPSFNKSLKAAVDLSAKQFYYVSDNGSELANIAGGINGAVGLGFLMNQPEANEECEIATTGGGAKGIAAETISAALTALKADANGKMAIALPGDIVSAIALQTAAVDDIFELRPTFYVKSAAPVVFQAAADLTSGQYLYVNNDSGDINVAGADERGYGFLMNAPDIGEDAVINGPGQPFAKCISGAAFSIDAELKSDANGKMIAATTADDPIVAIAFGAATGADETIDVIPVLYRKHA